MADASETVIRRLLSTYFVDGWVGPSGTDKTYCAIGVQGASFDPASDADCAPFTALEVRGDESQDPPLAGVGYALVSYREIDVDPNPGVSSGLDDAGDFGAPGATMVTQEFSLWNVQWAFRIPAGADIALWETYRQRVRELATGLAIRHVGPPRLTLRILSKYPPRARGDFDDGSWRLSFYDLKVEVSERIPHVGAVAVSLP